MGWCEDGKDLNGNVTTVTARKVFVDGSAFTVTAQAAGSPSTKGETFYTTGIMLIRGTHTYELTETNAQGESSKSAPFVLAVTPPLTVPHAPVIKSVRQP